MELQRRYGAGRLSEIFGHGQRCCSIPRMRVLGLHRPAEAAFSKLSPTVRRRGIEAYCAGVNAYVAAQGLMLPPEFLMLRFKPEPWTPADHAGLGQAGWTSSSAATIAGNCCVPGWRRASRPTTWRSSIPNIRRMRRGHLPR